MPGHPPARKVGTDHGRSSSAARSVCGEREILPIPDRPYGGFVAYDAKSPDSGFPPIEPLRPPAGAPNVLVVLLDDVGFGASSAYGGPISTPTAERLAAGGLKYTRFHTTALCSPTRQALLTGRNHHSVGMGGITEIATSAPGYSSIRPNTAAPLAETLKLNGYATAQFGKCHEVPVWETSPAGPFDAWPTGGGGFEYFYGFIGGEAHQYYPVIYEGTTPAEPSRTRRTRLLQPLRGRLGPCHGHPLPVDQADCLPLGRHPQRDDHPLAERVPLRRRASLPVPPHHRPGPDDPRGCGPARAGQRQRRAADAAARRQHGLHLRRPRRARPPRDPVLRDVREPRHLHKGWTAVTRHKTPWILVGEEVPAFDDDRWELYDTANDWSQAHDLSREHPDKLHELQRLWLIEAVKYNVLPLEDRAAERFNPDLAGRPVLIKGNSQLLFGGMGRLSESSVVSIKNKPHSVTAEVVVPESGAEGVIIAQGGSIGGWSLYAKDGKPRYCYNSACSASTSRGTGRSRQASTRCGWSSATTAAGSARAATSCCSWTARRSARAGSGRPRRWSSRPTTPATSAWRAAPWCRRTTGRAATSSAAR